MCLTTSSGNMLEVAKIADQVESRLGRLPFMGRYHVEPRRIEHDYKPTQRVLGKGCSGLVRMATSISDANRKFAVKSFTLNKLRDIELSHLKGELATSLCLDHPNVARLADVYETDRELYIVTECIEGGELLERFLKKKRFVERDAANAMRQVLLALSYLHSHGIVHRDLKLENFLYSSDTSEHLKLIDFGFSKFFANDFSQMSSTCGTLSYLAPEVLTANYSGSTCDMWSAGVLAYVLLSGSMPFHGSQETKVKSIYHGKYDMKPEVWNPLSRQAREFTESLLDRNAKTRLTAKSALAHPWIQENCRDKQPLLQNPQDVLDALSAWQAVPKLRRACLTMLAWSLSDEERTNFQDSFLALDSDHNGAISYSELQKVMTERCGIDQSKVKPIFDNLHLDNNDEIRYSDFIAVFMSTKVEAVDDSLLQTAFRKFDKNNVGYLTCDDFAAMTGLERDFVSASSILSETNAQKEDARIDYNGFKEYIKRKIRRSGKIGKIARDRVTLQLREAVGSDRGSKAKSRLDAKKEVPVAQQQCCTLM